MRKSLNRTINMYLALLALTFTMQTFSQKSEIKGWYLAGSTPASYEIGLVNNGQKGTKVAYLRSKDEKIEGFGTIMQNFEPGEFAGKKVRLTAKIKANNVESWSGMWMRVDGEEAGKRKTLSFDNMFDRAIKGSLDWEEYEIILQVPENSTGISYGVLVNGKGEVLIDDFKFEIIDPKSATTGNAYPGILKKPTNTSFEDSGKL